MGIMSGMMFPGTIVPIMMRGERVDRWNGLEQSDLRLSSMLPSGWLWQATQHDLLLCAERSHASQRWPIDGSLSEYCHVSG